MGKLLSSYKKALLTDFVEAIDANTARYYAFASNPVPNNGDIPADANDDHSNIYQSNHLLMFGKRITNTDIKFLTRKIEWVSNTVYARYDDINNNLANSNFFVVVPADPGFYHHVYKCIDNANGAPSTDAPNLQQSASFTKADGYTWRYLYSISANNYGLFATSEYIPITANATVQAAANTHNGLEVIYISNAGTGYMSYHDGQVQSVVNTTLIQIENLASTDNEFYTNNGIYLYNNNSSTGQLLTVSSYVSNISGNWVYLDSAANTAAIITGVTNYKISPKIAIDTDALDKPYAYSVINTTSNSIGSIVIIETGSGVTRATATVQSNTLYGHGANLHCIVPPPGGHGADPENELGVEAIGFSFTFNQSESNVISTNILYNRIGIYKNPYILQPNLDKGAAYVDTAFDQLLHGRIYPTVVFANNETVIGQESGAVGIIAYLSGNTISLVGDKHFTNNELIVSANGEMSTTLTINTHGQIYVTDLWPLYTQNIDDVSRANNQSEVFKITIKV